MSSSNPIVFYDIASAPPRKTFAPNPWKTRYALNFKSVAYRTQWTELPDIKSVRQSLNAAPNRTLPDGSDFYTLPVIQDPSNSNHVVGDTFDIAVYLDKTYPNPQRTLIPPGTAGLTAALNLQVDTLFTNHILLFSHGMRFNPEVEDEVHRLFSERMNGLAFEDMRVMGQAKVDLWDKFKVALGDFRKSAYRCAGDGVFLNGEDTPVYADLIIGGWLGMIKATVSQDEWTEFSQWHDGHWGRLHGALEKFAEIK